MSTEAGGADVGLRERLLRSLMRGGGAYLALFLVVHAVLAAGRDGWTPVDALLLALVGAPQAILATRRRAALAPWLTVPVCAVVVAAAAIGVWTLPLGAGGSSYAAWFLGAIAFDLLGLTLVGRYGAAWATMLVVAGITVAWSEATEQGLGLGVGLVVRHVATLLIGTALAVGLRRSDGAFRAARATARARTAEEHAARASAAARRTAAERVLEQAGPMLQAVASGRRLTDEDRRQMLVLEGALRDEIRAPDLLRDGLRSSVDGARRRGVDVLLMDEAPATDDQPRAAAVSWLAARLDEVGAGAFVGRLRVVDGDVRASAVTDTGGEAETFAAVSSTGGPAADGPPPEPRGGVRD